MPGEKRLSYVRTLSFVTDGDEVLMLRGAPTKRLYANLYNGLGGHLESGEDVLACVRREVSEEAGLELAAVRLRAIVNVDEAGKHGVLLCVFLAKPAGRQVTPSGEGSLAWVRRADLPDLDLVPDLRQVLPEFLNPSVAGVWFGRFQYDRAGGLTSIAGQWCPAGGWWDCLCRGVGD